VLITMIDQGIRRSTHVSGTKKRKVRRTAVDPVAARANAGTSDIPTYFQTKDRAPLM